MNRTSKRAAELQRAVASGLPIDNPQSVLVKNRECVVRMLTVLAGADLAAAAMSHGLVYESLEHLRDHGEMTDDMRDAITTLLALRASATKALS